ncbi:MAG: thrombospondin type 3 repeat-containing protein [Methanobacteriota archaeon]
MVSLKKNSIHALVRSSIFVILILFIADGGMSFMTIFPQHQQKDFFHFHPQDNTPPIITINFAGNTNEKGGPYYIPPLEYNGGILCPNGYYTNDSHQHEQWMFINITVNGTGSEPTVPQLLWCQRIDDVLMWNTTLWTFRRTGSTGKPYEYYYEFNTKGNITITQEGCFSFDIRAQDSNGNSARTWWNKTGIGGNYTRRYVSLGCADDDTILYTPFYLYEPIPLYGIPGHGNDTGKPDRFHHDQGPDGSDHDTGILLAKIPTDKVENRWCTTYTGFWFDESLCVQNYTLRNIYYHVWCSIFDGPNNICRMAWNKSRGPAREVATNYFFWNSDTDPVSSVQYDIGYPDAVNDTYGLMAHLLPVRATPFTDNDIYEFAINSYGMFPSQISNRSFTSFVLFNVPDNQTLNTSYVDTDYDGLSDWTELYRTYTNPFLSDTDNDGWSDNQEIMIGTDPNNYTDYLKPQTRISDLSPIYQIAFDPLPYHSEHPYEILYIWPFTGQPSACEPYPLSYLATTAFGPSYTYQDEYISSGALGIRIGNYAGEQCTLPQTNMTLTYINDQGGIFTIYLPAIDLGYHSNENNIYFWVAEDGSTYYAHSTHGPGCPDLSPTEAISSEHLARRAE